jgi:hypothetical protein
MGTEGAGHLPGGREPIVRPLRNRSDRDGLDRRAGAASPIGRGRLLVQVRVDRRHLGVTPERGSPGQALVQHAPE